MAIRVGILTSGGDCPGLNATLRGVAKALYHRMGDKVEIVGIMNGYDGLINGNYREMSPDEFSGILTVGGTILGTKRTPFKKMRVVEEDKVDKVAAMKKNYRAAKLDCLLCLGGNGTHKTANLLSQEGLNVIGLPKTIDNDIYGTDVTFGFHTAVDIATEVIDRIHTTAGSHSRVMCIEIMGNKAGWLTLYSGIAGGADIILLPGSKNTLADLQSIRANGIADTIVRAYKRGKKVIGICGGYQMMGARLEDPEGIEGNLPAVPGLGLLPQCTVIEQEKVTKQSRFTFRNGSPMICKGYEIHMGQTSLLGNAPESPVALLEDGRKDGYYLNDHCWGSYMHGILDNPEVLDNLAKGFNKEADNAPFDYAAFKEEQYDKLADLVRKHVDMEYIYSTL